MHSKPRGFARLQYPLQRNLASLQSATGQKQLGHKCSWAFTQPGAQVNFSTLHGNEVTKNKALCYHSNNTLKSLQRRYLKDQNIPSLETLQLYCLAINYVKERIHCFMLPTSLSGSLIFPPSLTPARRKDERPWERGWHVTFFMHTLRELRTFRWT